ncbi:hypothetical protein Mboo_0520 [Methanoregula boonei 6A8]|uniref:Uncharacterized protein n=1 Tax=Methanoregula boonei (strain DSM 21154 / JCM 14090 / 6A8) TaxID=456442 RepID=A7I5M7_METB6|nr:hypothetical protein [Methanoregula boonei]ABS55038.1 hypothetical protein Mboo_0520 [Methanoregula boonei 6A8]
MPGMFASGIFFGVSVSIFLHAFGFFPEPSSSCMSKGSGRPALKLIGPIDFFAEQYAGVGGDQFPEPSASDSDFFRNPQAAGLVFSENPVTRTGITTDPG